MAATARLGIRRRPANRGRAIESATHIGPTFQKGPIVHEALKPGLEAEGFIIEGPGDRGKVPQLRRAVLHGEGAALERWYDFDGWNPDRQIALEIEGGKAMKAATPSGT